MTTRARALQSLALFLLLMVRGGELVALAGQAAIGLLHLNARGGQWLSAEGGPGGLTGDARSFWLLDVRSKVVRHIANADGHFLDQFTLPYLRAPRGIAFDGSHLWVADNATRTLHLLSLHGKEERPAISASSPLSENHGIIADLSWDGKQIWTAVGAGFASSFNQIDADTGVVLHSYYADCNPVGLTVRGERLWSLCDNGPGQPRTLNRVLLNESVRAKRFAPLGPVESSKAGGLFFDGLSLWTLDIEGPMRFSSKSLEKFP
jgi:hypothetical protein